MNNLVAYNSSDEEDVHVIEPNKTILSLPPKPESANTPLSKLQVEINEGPALGPSLAPDGLQSYEDYEDEDGENIRSTMTERDMVRYLTQPSHPMTEMPSSPPGSPDPSTAARFKRFLDLKAKGMHFNQDLAQKSGFKNPSLLYTLMQRADLEKGSEHCISLPREIFDPRSFPVAAFKEELLKSQQTIRAKLDAEQKSLSVSGKRSLEFTSAGSLETSHYVHSPAGTGKRQKQ